MKMNETKKDNRVPLILFSGGLDSSYLLETMLEKSDVDTLYVSGDQHPVKIERELIAREKIIEILEKRTGNRVRIDHKATIPHFGGMTASTFVQPMMWLNGALLVSDHYRHTELLVGYVCGDQIGCKLSHIEQAWLNIQTISKWGNIGIRFPLQLTTKQNILERIGSDIVQHIWICETPHKIDGVIKACKECVPCRTIDTELYKWKKSYGHPYCAKVLRRLKYQAIEKSEKILDTDKLNSDTYAVAADIIG
jgi:7-cyano-7-deazaguanine synthase in queuosine biosynthesis